MSTPEELICMYPKVDLFLCTNDPLHDDGIRFGHRLIESGNKCQITVFKNQPHGLLNLDVPNGMPEAKEFVSKTIQSLENLFNH